MNKLRKPASNPKVLRDGNIKKFLLLLGLKEGLKEQGEAIVFLELGESWSMKDKLPGTIVLKKVAAVRLLELRQWGEGTSC
jgi:hypothetical protein